MKATHTEYKQKACCGKHYLPLLKETNVADLRMSGSSCELLRRHHGKKPRVFHPLSFKRWRLNEHMPRRHDSGQNDLRPSGVLDWILLSGSLRLSSCSEDPLAKMGEF